MQKVLADAELGQKYRQRYAPTPEVVDPATYGGEFNFSAPSDNLADSLSSHQSDSLDSSADDLMGGGGEPLEEPAVTPRPEEVQSSSSRTVVSSQKTGTQKVKKEKESGEDLFN